jgi:hypothetical protein
VISVAELTVKLVAIVPLNVTTVAPVKLVPVMVTLVPAGPLAGKILEMPGASAMTVKGKPLLVPSAPLTTTLPVVAPAGTVAIICVELICVELLKKKVVASTPLKVTLTTPFK